VEVKVEDATASQTPTIPGLLDRTSVGHRIKQTKWLWVGGWVAGSGSHCDGTAQFFLILIFIAHTSFFRSLGTPDIKFSSLVSQF